MNINLQFLNPRNRQPGTARLGLAFDGSRLEVVEVRRTNGSVEIVKSFTTTLSLDLLTNAPELVGREIRKALDEHGIRERWCTVCLPLNWTLMLSTQLPELAEEDVASFLQLEAERGFPYGPDALISRTSRFHVGKASWASLIGIPLSHITRLEEVLTAAQLRPATFSIGMAALQPANGPESDGVLALVKDEFVTLRLPYPLGFYAKGFDGRIDDPNAGWKGRGIYATYGADAMWHIEGGPKEKNSLIKFQMRPDPLAK